MKGECELSDKLFSCYSEGAGKLKNFSEQGSTLF